GWIRRNKCIRSYTEVAETAAAVKVLRIPPLASRHNRDAFLRADPGTYTTACTSIKMEQMPPPVSLLNCISLLRKSQRVRSMEEMTDTCEIGDRDIDRRLRFPNDWGHCFATCPPQPANSLYSTRP